ncbi:ABC transporter substrate-binding protein, partial [Campylobacter coli]
MKKKIILAAALALSLQAKEVKLGVVLPLSGATAAYGQSALEGIKLANEMQSTLANGDKINLVVLDTKGDKIESASAATRLVNQDKVLGLIGEMVTANTLQVMRIAEENKVPLIAPAATGDKLLENKLYSSRVCFMDSFQGSSLAKYAFEKLNHKKAVIVVDQSTDYSLGLAKA